MPAHLPRIGLIHPVLCRLAAAVLALLATDSLRAQSFDASQLRRPTELSMPWRMHAGDNPAFADPNFDDSQWTVFDPHRPLTELLRTRPDVVWYRLHVRLAPGQSHLAVGEISLASAFEIYANGQRIMASGSFTPPTASNYNARLLANLPDTTPGGRELVLAVRIYIFPNEWSPGNYPGLYAGNLTIGDAGALTDHRSLELLSTLMVHGLNMVLSICVGLAALALYLAQRTRREYLWILGLALLNVWGFSYSWLQLAHNLPREWSLVGDLAQCAAICAQIGMVTAFLDYRPQRWQKAALQAAVVLWIAASMGADLGALAIRYRVLAWLPVLLAAYLAMPLLLLLRFRRGNREAGILLIPVLLWSANIYMQVLIFFLAFLPGIPAATVQKLNNDLNNWSFGVLTIGLSDVCNFFFWASLGTILIWRSNRLSREQSRLESELEAARQVQQLIVPEQAAQVPGYAIEAVYQPASQVGGDFYQVIPTEGGELLVVLGDVSGKGLPAAMLVAVVVGAVRTVAAFTTDPARILAELNHRLLGRSANGFATCLALVINTAGHVTWANAGHLPPYLGGRALESPGALPLGIAGGEVYRNLTFQLEPGAALVCLSDGVVEAQNASGQLLGFERTLELSNSPAATVAAAAVDFGQRDDITVLRIERERLAIPAA